MHAFIRNICYRTRGLWDESAFTRVSTLTLALGIGACAVMFSIANAVLLRQLPHAKAERLVKVKQINANARPPNLCGGNFDLKSAYE